MKASDKRIVKQFKKLLSQKVDVREIRVFGSRARDDAAEESDLDVLVVVDELDHKKEKWVSECAWEAGFPNDVVVVPVTLSVNTLKNSPVRESVFIQNAYHEGIAL